ncbi:MAG: SBBP repeat-containing protein [Calditrichaeota bacterium]|nr:SBBP repeat-containing protein [Calditrichota bacterium]
MRWAIFILIFVSTFAAVAAGGGSYWIANQGQWEGDFQFKCEVGSAVYYVTPKGMTVDFREFHRYPRAWNQHDPLDGLDRDGERDSVTVSGHVVQIHYVGAESKLASGDGRFSHYSNYFLGRDSTNWRSRVPHYQTVIAEEVWPGISVEYRADKQGVETVYHVQPGADPTQIQIDYIGLDALLRIDAQGNLILATSLGEAKEQAPYAYQIDGRTQKRIESTYRIIDNNRVAFEFEGFDAGKELVVDPLLYGTYLGGGATDDCFSITADSSDGVYVVGYTYALSDFPTTPGAYDETGMYFGIRNFVCHFGADGEFIASTLLGETQSEENPSTDGYLVDVVFDSLRGSVWVCGNGKTDWPVTTDAMDSVGDSLRDAVVLRLSGDLSSLEYCSYLGGDDRDVATAIAIDVTGRLIVAGNTRSANFPVSTNAVFSELRFIDCFVWVFEPTSRQVVFSSYFGGSDAEAPPKAILLAGDRIWLSALTYSSDIPVTGSAFQHALADSASQLGDAMIACITINSPSIEYCSYLGGSGIDDPYSLGLEDSLLFVMGETNSKDFPVSSNAFDTTGPAQLAPDHNDGFVSSLNWHSAEYHGTYLGGSGADRILANKIHLGTMSVTLLGRSTSSDLPITANAYQPFSAGGLDGFVVKISRDMSSLLYGTYLGGSADDQFNAAWIENVDSLWLCGSTLSINLPTTPNAIQPGDNGLSSGFVQHFAIDTTADTTSASHAAPIPSDFTLSVYPNPFNPTTTLAFNLPNTSEVEIVVHDELGREVTREHLGRLVVGQHEYRLDGSKWTSGIYFVTLDRNSIRTSVKLALVK